MLFFKQEISLWSSLPPTEVWDRLNEMLPRFLVPSGDPIPRYSLTLSRFYVGKLTGKQFTLIGPRKYALTVRGSIAPSGDGTLISLTVQPAKATEALVVCCAAGIVGGVLVAIMDRERLIVPLIVAFPVLGCSAGGFLFLIHCLPASPSINELLECLERRLNACRQPGGAVKK